MIDKVRVNVYLEGEVRSKALEKAKKMGLTFSGLVNLALHEYIKQDLVVQLLDLYKEIVSERRAGAQAT